MNNVILIGMPGAGKSTLGVLLAKTLGMTFLDTDLLLQQQEKSLLPDLIARQGIDGFLALEGTLCAGLEADNAVIATGGSVVYQPEGMAKLGYRTLSRRLGNLKHRGVVLRPGQTPRMLYDERVPLYETYADLIVDCGQQDIEHTLQRVLQALKKAGTAT